MANTLARTEQPERKGIGEQLEVRGGALGERDTNNVAPDDPVIGQENRLVVDEASGQWVYALRINGDSFQPKVFKQGSYTVEVNGKPVTGLKATTLNDPQVVEVQL